MLAIYRPIVTDTATSFELEPPSEEEFRERISRTTENNPWLVMEIDGRLVGYAYASDFRPRPAYAATRETTVYVHPEYQRSGVGAELMGALLDELVRRGAHVAVAFIALPNDPSVELHERIGYEYVGILHGVGRKLERWHDIGIWELDLSTRPRGLQ
jgi:phosphinothricin acetyltransferase